MEKLEPGIYPDMENETYHGHEGSYSKSSLVDFSAFPYNLIWRRENREKKLIWDLGTACHTAILEPEKFEGSLAVIPPEVLGKNGAKSTNAYKAWRDDQPEHLAIVSEDQRDMVLRIRDSVMENPAHSEAARHLKNGAPEVSCFWEEQFRGDETDEETGYHFMLSDQYSDPGENTHKIMLKCRPDYLPGAGVTVDLKTTGVLLEKEAFMRQAVNLHYHWSAGMTLRGLSLATKKLHKKYVFVVVQINPPHEVAVYQADQDFIALGLKETMHTLQRLAYCDKHNRWPGFPNKVLQLGLPGYLHRKLYNNE